MGPFISNAPHQLRVCYALRWRERGRFCPVSDSVSRPALLQSECCARSGRSGRFALRRTVTSLFIVSLICHRTWRSKNEPRRVVKSSVHDQSICLVNLYCFSYPSGKKALWFCQPRTASGQCECIFVRFTSEFDSAYEMRSSQQQCEFVRVGAIIMSSGHPEQRCMAVLMPLWWPVTNG